MSGQDRFFTTPLKLCRCRTDEGGTPMTSLSYHRIAATTGRPTVTSPRDRALTAIDDMLDRLETVTRAGQQHLMVKIVEVLTTHPLITAAGPFVTTRLDDLRREASKAAPDGGAFAHATRALLSAARILG
jgi:hypothetical protein